MASTQQDTDVAAEVTAWLEEHWDPDLTVGEWWERLGTSGWAAPTLPVEAFGKGLGRADGIRAVNAIASFGALGPPGGLGLLLAGPTISVHGDPEQIQRYVRDIVTGQKAWCQLFSEPGAGSDLAGLTTRAVKDGDEWIVNGQKVWTSGAQVADMGMLLARTNPDVPKHQGITWFAFDMHQPGVDIRPLREMTGRAMFNEVFLTDVQVPEDAAIGGIHQGWKSANTTLAFERAGLGAGGGGAAGYGASPGTIVGDLEKRVGDFIPKSAGKAAAAGRPAAAASMLGGGNFLVQMAKDNGTINDPTIRQELMKLHSMTEIGRYTTLRAKALGAIGKEIPGMGNIAKLAMSRIMRQNRDTGLRIAGPYGGLHAYEDDDRKVLTEATGMPMLGAVTETALMAQGPPIYGGTDQIQHNIIGERILGLPREPNNFGEVPFRELPKNG